MNPQRILRRYDCIGGMASLVIMLLLACSSLAATAGKIPAGFTEHYAEVNGVRIHYSIGGKGSPVALLHGYAQTSHMWNPIMPLLAKDHTVIVPDLRGAGGSSKPESGYDKKSMAVDIHALVSSLGFKRASIVGPFVRQSKKHVRLYGRASPRDLDDGAVTACGPCGRGAIARSTG